MRLIAVASVLSVLVAAATFACSSSDPVTPAADAGKDAKATPKTDDDDDVSNTDTDSGNGISDPPETQSEAGVDSGDAGTIPGTTDAGKNCKATSTPEIEPNADLATATKLPAEKKQFALCGQVVSGDVDVFTFDTPDFDNGFGVTPSGDNVNYSIDIGDKHFDGFPGSFGLINPGDKWVITVKTGNANGRSYAVDFDFN